MGNTRTEVVAPCWRRQWDRETGTLTWTAQPAEGDEPPGCLVVLVPIPNTEPVEFEVTCRNAGCSGECLVEILPTPEGDLVHCVCAPPGPQAMTTATGHA